ncbi:MAG TPA: FTR1 family protein [Vicinamibacterales bacterium]|nr:FTR1 family protein [Vicinamibacterales bacterium]
MLQAFIITLREGLEAFLIVAISLAYLRKTGRPQLVSAVHWGIGVAMLLSIGAAMLFQRANNQALWEGVLALTAAVLVSSLIVHMWRHAKRMKKDIERHLESSALKVGTKALIGVFLFTLLMITREGMETALLMGTLLFQESGTNILAGAVAGTICAAFVAWLWSRYGHRVNLALFFQVTALFLAVFVLQLLIYGFHELTEANIFPYSEPLHWATEPYGPDGRYGQFLSYLLLALPLAWLAFAGLFGSKRGAVSMQQTAAR